MIVFEDKALTDKATMAVEKQIHFEDNDPSEAPKQEVRHVEVVS